MSLLHLDLCLLIIKRSLSLKTTLMMESDDEVNEEPVMVTRFSINRARLNTLGKMVKLQYVF